MNEEKVNETTEETTSEKSYFGMGSGELAELVKAFMENKDAVKEIIEIFKPVVGEVSDMAMDTVGPELYKIIKRVSVANVGIKKAVYDKYVEVGFTQEQAFYMITLEGNDGAKASKLFEAASKSVVSK